MTYALGTLVDPFVRPVRRVIPMIGRFDLSPIVVILLANVLLILVNAGLPRLHSPLNFALNGQRRRFWSVRLGSAFCMPEAIERPSASPASTAALNCARSMR